MVEFAIIDHPEYSLVEVQIVHPFTGRDDDELGDQETLFQRLGDGSWISCPAEIKSQGRFSLINPYPIGYDQYDADGEFIAPFFSPEQAASETLLRAVSRFGSISQMRIDSDFGEEKMTLYMIGSQDQLDLKRLQQTLEPVVKDYWELDISQKAVEEEVEKFIDEAKQVTEGSVSAKTFQGILYMVGLDVSLNEVLNNYLASVGSLKRVLFGQNHGRYVIVYGNAESEVIFNLTGSNVHEISMPDPDIILGFEETRVGGVSDGYYTNMILPGELKKGLEGNLRQPSPIPEKADVYASFKELLESDYERAAVNYSQQATRLHERGHIVFRRLFGEEMETLAFTAPSPLNQIISDLEQLYCDLQALRALSLTAQRGGNSEEQRLALAAMVIWKNHRNQIPSEGAILALILDNSRINPIGDVEVDWKKMEEQSTSLLKTLERGFTEVELQLQFEILVEGNYWKGKPPPKTARVEQITSWYNQYFLRQIEDDLAQAKDPRDIKIFQAQENVEGIQAFQAITKAADQFLIHGTYDWFKNNSTLPEKYFPFAG